MSSTARIYLSPPHMSGREQAYIDEVFASNFIAPVGPHLTRFEQEFAEYIGVGHAAAVSSGTAAIHLVLRVLGIQPGDTVLCSTFTFCASANPIVYQGAEPVFIDADRSTWNLDPLLVEDELTESARAGRLPKAIVAVDALGQPADILALRQLAERFEVPLVEDAAESLGSSYHGRPAGAMAWASTFSFNGNKIITTSGGGMLCSDDAALVEQARYLATQAREPVPHYEHHTHGYNYRLSNVLAAIGIAQLEVLDQRVAARRRIRESYREQLGGLPGISLMPEASYGESNAWLTTILVEPSEFGADSEALRQELERHNIESRRVWKPLHCQPAFTGTRCRGGSVAEWIFARGLNLPSGSALTDTDIDRICGIVRRFAESNVAAAGR